MIYEIRTYSMKPGTVGVFEQRFADGLPSREKYSKLAAFWHTDVGPLNQVIHVWPYEDMKHREEVRVAAARDTGGKWPPKSDDAVVSMDVQILLAAPFMRPLTGEAQELGSIYEMRIYTYQQGCIPKVLATWKDRVPHREVLSPLVACWYSDLGTLNQFYHVWPYKDAHERTRIRAEATRDPKYQWPPPTAEWLLTQENKLLIPAAFSPLR